MRIASRSLVRRGASLVVTVAVALASADFEAWAQSSTSDREAQCSGLLLSMPVGGDSANNAYCRGYLGQPCDSREFADACQEGARARALRKETAGVQGNQSEAEAMERDRRLVEQLPPLPVAGNPLLGRWRKLPAPPPRNSFEALGRLGTDVTCALIAGDGPSFEFRADALVHGARAMDSMRYYRGNAGVFFALGERYLRLLAFEFDGRDRITNGPCRFERVSGGAATVSSAPSRPVGLGCAGPVTRLGVDTVASVERDIKARGGSVSFGSGRLGKFRMSALSGDYADAGANVSAVSYDFDAPGPTGKTVAVTIARRAVSTPEFDRMLAERKASIAASIGPLQQQSATEFQASASSCRLNLTINPGTSYLYETYQLPQ